MSFGRTRVLRQFFARTVEGLQHLLVFSLLLMAGGVFAEPVSLTSVERGSLGLHAGVLLEQAQPLTLEQARALQQAGAFRPGKAPMLGFGIGSRPVWVHLALDNPTQQALPFQLTVGVTWIDYLDVHVVHDGKVTSWQTGDSYPNVKNMKPAEGFVFFPVFAPGRSELYLRAQTDDPLVLSMDLLASEKVAESQHPLSYSYGFLYGFLAALAIYNGVLYAGLRNRSHLYYALYLLSFIVLNIGYTGHGYAWWWSAYPEFQRYSSLAMMVLYGCAGFLFANSFLALDEHAPLVARWVRWLVMTGLGLLGLSLVLGSHYGEALVAFNFVTLYSIVMVVIGILMVRHRHVPGRYFLVATVFGLLGTLLTALSVWGWLPFNLVTYHGAEIGLMLEAILLALALAAQMRQTDAARQSAEQLARIDPLTGLNNRRAFLELVQPLWRTSERNARPVSLIMLDIDHFKQINDQYGHEVGDRVLIEVAQLLSQSCRAGDVLSRWGGEEFVMLLPETGLEQAFMLAERIRQLIAAKRLPVNQQLIAFTASFGVAERGEQAGLEALINEADGQLYAAKSGGRNRVTAKP